MMFLNKNKKIKYFATLSLVVAASLFSCEDVVDEEPISFTSSEGFFEASNANLESGLVTAYSFLRTTYRNRYFQWGDLRSDSFAPNGNDVERATLHNNIMDPADEDLLRWADPYQAIDAVNRIIESAPLVESLDNNILAQALAIRAKIYFDLVRVWGDVPLFTQPVSSVEDVFTSVVSAEVITRDVIIPDMRSADSLVVADSNDFRFSRSSILALQGEVYLWEGENELARDVLLELETLGTHRLVTTPEAWEELFSNQRAVPRFPLGRGKLQMGPELIFSIPFNDPQVEEPSSVLSLYAGGAKQTLLSTQVEDKWLERFPADETWDELYPDTPPVFTTIDDETGEQVPLYGDWRLFATRENGSFEDGIGITLGDARIEKWQEERAGLSNNQDDTDIVVYRYADIVLMIAEAELKLGNTQEALARINQIRQARQLPQVTIDDFGGDFETQLDYLLDERQFELFAEGKRWWDLVRNDRAVETMNPILVERLGTSAVLLTEDRVFWPIFNEHITDNQNLSQNTGW